MNRFIDLLTLIVQILSFGLLNRKSLPEDKSDRS